jgi:microcin C transport system substrate-binding protein
VDALIDLVLAARTADEFYPATRALDRVLLWNFYYLPGQAQPGYRLVYWDKFGQPAGAPPLQRSTWLDAWWWDEQKATRIRDGITDLTGSQ